MEPHDNEPPTAAPSPPDEPLEPVANAELSKDEQNLGMLAHLLGAFTSFVAPLIIWLVKKDESAFVEAQSREALNFQITVAIGFVALGAATCLTFGLSALLMPLLWIYMLVMSVVAALKAKDGHSYRYPATLRLVK